MATLREESRKFSARLSTHWGKTWPGLDQPHRDLRGRKWWALGLVLAAMFIGWSAGTLRAGAVLADAYSQTVYGDDWGRALSASLENLSLGLAVALVAYLGIKYYLGVQPSLVGLSVPKSRHAWKRTFFTAGAFITLMIGAGLVAQIFGGFSPWLVTPFREELVNGYAEGRTGWDYIVSLTNCLAAGSEELAFVALPVLLLTAAGFQQGWIWALAVVFRLSFHIYYFPHMIWLVVWAIGTLIIFRMTGNLWGMITAHIVWDITAVTADFPGLETGGWIAFTLLLLGGLALFIVGLVRDWGGRSTDAGNAHRSPEEASK